MMTTKRSSRWQQLRALAVVPVAALAVVAFASPEVESVSAEVEQAVSPLESAVLTSPASQAEQLASAGSVSQMPLRRMAGQEEAISTVVAGNDTTEVFEVVEQMPEFPGGMEALMKFLKETVKYPKDAMEAQKMGRVLVTFIVDRDGTVTDPSIVRSVFPSLDEEALRVVNAMPKWTPGRQKGKDVRVKFTLPITFRLQGDEGKKDAPQTKPLTIIHKGDAPAGENPLIIIDGKEATMAVLQALDTEKIESINVLKDKSAVDVYGEKGKNGVIEIKLKK